MKHISLFFFGTSFLLTVNVFLGIGREFLPFNLARYIFLACGLLGFFFKIISYKDEKDKLKFNLLFWIGSLILFLGLYAKILHYKHYIYPVICGLLLSGISFFFQPDLENDSDEDTNTLLDN